MALSSCAHWLDGAAGAVLHRIHRGDVSALLEVVWPRAIGGLDDDGANFRGDRGGHWWPNCAPIAGAVRGDLAVECQVVVAGAAAASMVRGF